MNGQTAKRPASPFLSEQNPKGCLSAFIPCAFYPPEAFATKPEVRPAGVVFSGEPVRGLGFADNSPFEY
jgi:hypothetical protein